MLRRSAISLLAGAAGVAAGCGRQITPNPKYNNLAGFMVVRFRVQGTLDFTNLNYVIVFNTSGVGGEPYPNVYATSFLNYSYSFAIGASFQGSLALPTLFQYIVVPGSSNQLNPRQVPVSTSTVQLLLNDNGQGNEFQLTFLREQLNNPLGFSPSPSASASTSSTPSTSPTPTPSPTPTITPSPGPSVSPSASPSATPPGVVGAPIWYINFFTVANAAQGGAVLDSLGIGGPNDTTFNFPVNTASTNFYPINRTTPISPPSNPSAYITGSEVDTYF